MSNARNRTTPGNAYYSLTTTGLRNHTSTVYD